MPFDLAPNFMPSYLGSQQLMKLLYRTPPTPSDTCHPTVLRPPTRTRPVKSKE
jgi:hypothetical protein